VKSSVGHPGAPPGEVALHAEALPVLQLLLHVLLGAARLQPQGVAARDNLVLTSCWGILEKRSR